MRFSYLQVVDCQSGSYRSSDSSYQGTQRNEVRPTDVDHAVGN